MNDATESFQLESSAVMVNLFAFGLPHNRVELSFTQRHPVRTIINGLRHLRRGTGCRSWLNEIVRKRQNFNLSDIKLLITCSSRAAAYHAKFIVLDKIQNSTNIRRIITKQLIDPNRYLESRLSNSNCVLNE